MTQFMEVLTPALMSFLATCLACLFGYLGKQVKEIYNEKVNTEIKKDVVNSTVSYVEQVFTDIHGEKKLGEAIQTARELLNEKGINVTDNELKVLIESAVNAFNSGFKQ